jgi:DNA-binding transcriptional MocR family regulator
MSIPYIVTMTIWSAAFDKHSGPRYLAIADHLEAAITTGEFSPGARLPTHRALAEILAVTVGTVSRGYAEAERRGLVRGEVGRGTFVRGGEARDPLPNLLEERLGEPGFLDLGINLPPEGPDSEAARAMAETLAQLARERGPGGSLGHLVGYLPHAGSAPHRRAGAEWVGRHGVEVDPEQVLVTCGAQHAIAVILSALARPSDPVLAEALTYSGFLSLAELLHLDVAPVGIDREGLRADSLEAALSRQRARLLYVVPTIQNPTGGVLSLERRQRIVELARKHDLWILEDAVHGRLLDDAPPPLAALAPERTFFVAGTSKSVAPGLRIGYLASPPEHVERLASAVWSTAWAAPPLMAEIATRWIADGTAERLLAGRRAESRARQSLARAVLGDLHYESHPESFHLWLYLPRTWRFEEFVLAARRKGVGVTPPTAFRAGSGAVPRAVRVCLGAAPDRDSLRHGLEILARLAHAGPQTPTGLA